jgi:hypothetical protein
MQRQLAAEQIAYQGIGVACCASQTAAGSVLLGIRTEQQPVRQVLQPGPSAVA